MAKQPIRKVGGKTTSKVSFSSALKKQGGWEKSRNAEDQFGKSVPDDVGDGTYVCKIVKAECGVSKKGDPYCKFHFAIARGESKGANLVVSHFLTAPKKAGGQTLAEKQERLVVDLTRLNYDMSEQEEGDVEEICKQLTAEKPLVQLRVTTGSNDGRFVNINKLLEDGNEEGEGESEEATEGDGDVEEGTEGEGEGESGAEAESKDSGEATEEEEGPVTPEKGNLVKCKLPGLKGTPECEVTAIQVKAETVTVKSVKTKKEYKGIAWSDLEYVMEE